MNKKGLRVIRDIMMFFLAKATIIADEWITALIDMYVP
jgi:hypothetical protein